MPRSLRRLTLILALTASVLAATPAISQARAPRGFVGITAEDVFAGNGSYRSSNLAAQKSIGVRLIRQTFNWRSIETSPGVYNLGAYDGYVGSLASQGIRVLPVLFDTPFFHSGTTKTRPSYPPRSNATMGRFAAALVRRYGPNGSFWSQNPGIRKVPITAWQIWNEPTLKVYWRNRPSARAYTRMVTTVSRSIRRVHRRAEIVSAGLPPSTLPGTIRLNRFIAQIYRARIGRSITSLAINSYAKNSRELSRLLRSIRKLMNRRGGRRDSIWITELGWATSGPRSRFNVGASGQARLIRSSFRFIRQNRRRLKLRGVVYFSWKDLAPYPPNFADLWGLHAGLLNRDGSRKPGYSAFSRSARAIR
jgi:hypothetical protein